MTVRSLTIVTFDRVPDFARGFVRDLRVRWAAEEAALPYTIAAISSTNRGDAHRTMQPFLQVPILKDGDLSLFESGAILWYLGEKSEALLPRETAAKAETMQWLFAALNTIEPAVMGWVLASIIDRNEAQAKLAVGRMGKRLDPLSDVLQSRDYIAAGRFTIADILVADVLRTIGSHGGLEGYQTLSDYVARMTARPAFVKSHQDQLAHWRASDADADAATVG